MQATPRSFGAGAAGEAAGVKVVGSRAKPGVAAWRASSSGFTHGAPTRRNGDSVPRPSLAFVASTRQVPGYARAASALRRFGDGLTQRLPVSAHVMPRVQSDIVTTLTVPGLRPWSVAWRAISPSVRPWTSGPGAIETSRAGSDESISGPSTRRPPSGLGRSSTTASIPASAAASRHSSIVLE